MKKTFRMTIAQLLEYAGIVLSKLKNDLSLFTAFDPDLNEDKVSEMQMQYDTGKEEGGDDVARGKVTDKTKRLYLAIENCSKAVKKLRYWAKKAFSDDQVSYSRLRLSRFNEVKGNQLKLIAYMNSLAKTVDILRPGLLATNTPVTVIDRIKLVAQELEAANIEQENQKDDRTLATYQRSVLLNALYASCLRFNDAADHVFEDSPIKRDSYRVPVYNSPGNNDGSDDNPDTDGSGSENDTSTSPAA